MALKTHLNLPFFCGACGGGLYQGDKAIALRGCSSSRAACSITPCFDFPQRWQGTPDFGNYHLCAQPFCINCRQAPEFVVIHQECYEVFVKEAALLTKEQALDRLWLLCSWKQPWRDAPDLHLAQTNPIHIPIIQRMEPLLDHFRLSKLPIELLSIIWQLSSRAVFWRTISALQLDSMKRLSPPLATIELGKVQYWDRESGKHCFSDQSPWMIQITIDFIGILRIERLAQPPAFSSEVNPSLAFIVEEAAKLDGVLLLMEYGLCRLSFPPNCTRPKIQDILGSNPAELVRMDIRKSPFVRFRSIDFRTVYGITFLYAYGSLFKVYPHRSRTGCAISVLEQMIELNGFVWLYMPISSVDLVLSCALRQRHGKVEFLIRLQKSGLVHLGRPRNPEPEVPDYWVGADQNPMLVYEEPVGGTPVPFIGIYGKRFKAHNNMTYNMTRSDPNMYFSTAPLRDIASVQIFYTELKEADSSKRLCKGLLFQYNDGAQRAVGQCRIFVDPSETHKRPVGFYFQPCQYCAPTPRIRDLSGVQVQMRTASLESSGYKNWEYAPLDRGHLVNFWFTHEECRLEVI